MSGLRACHVCFITNNKKTSKQTYLRLTLILKTILNCQSRVNIKIINNIIINAPTVRIPYHTPFIN